MEQPKYTLEDIEKLLNDINNIKESNEFIQGFRCALEVLIKSRKPECLRRYTYDDCPEYTGEGFNAQLLDVPLNTLMSQLNIAGYLGKAIIYWRLEIKK